MKVWIINHYAIPPSMGGLVRHYYFSKYLKEKGHEVKIFTSSKIHNTDINMISDKSLYIEKDMDGVEYTFVRNSDYKGNGLDRIFNMLQFPLQIWKAYKNFEKPDVIYTSSPDLFTALSAVLLAKKLKIKKVVEVRDLWPESIVEYSGKSRKNPVIQILYLLEKWLYKNADELIFTMAGGKKYIKEKKWEKSIDLNKIHHVNNGVDLEEFDYNKEHYQISDSDLEDNTIFKVVYTGSIRKVNNLGKIVECAKLLQEKQSNIKFLIWGEGNEKEQLQAQIKKIKLKNIVFKGRIEKKYIPYILSKADLNLIHNEYTPIMRFGCSLNKLFDYLATGKSILSDINPAYDLVSKYNCGETIKGNCALEIADTLYELENTDKELLKEYGENGRNLAKEYDYRKLTNKIEKILQEAISK